jgi:itaconyl-CoA hydratase
LEKRDAHRPDAGVVKFKLVGKRPDGMVVVEIERSVLIKRKSYFLKNS